MSGIVTFTHFQPSGISLLQDFPSSLAIITSAPVSGHSTERTEWCFFSPPWKGREENRKSSGCKGSLLGSPIQAVQQTKAMDIIGTQQPRLMHVVQGTQVVFKVFMCFTMQSGLISRHQSYHWALVCIFEWESQGKLIYKDRLQNFHPALPIPALHPVRGGFLCLLNALRISCTIKTGATAVRIHDPNKQSAHPNNCSSSCLTLFCVCACAFSLGQARPWSLCA